MEQTREQDQAMTMRQWNWNKRKEFEDRADGSPNAREGVQSSGNSLHGDPLEIRSRGVGPFWILWSSVVSQKRNLSQLQSTQS